VVGGDDHKTAARTDELWPPPASGRFGDRLRLPHPHRRGPCLPLIHRARQPWTKPENLGSYGIAAEQAILVATIAPAAFAGMVRSSLPSANHAEAEHRRMRHRHSPYHFDEDRRDLLDAVLASTRPALLHHGGATPRS
jgi:hypothetical protein